MTALKPLLCAALVIPGSGCATVINPKRVALPDDSQGPVDVDIVLMDVIFTASLGLFVDFAQGTLRMPTPGYRGLGYDPGLFGGYSELPSPPSPRP
jgi:hypothetical protein